MQQGRKPNLLLVDGDSKSLRLVDVSLKKAGFYVTATSNGREALAALESAVPDLIISDTNMPEMDGFELCRRLQQKPEWAGIPFIFLSARTPIEEKIRGLDLGVEDYLCKPIYIKELTIRVRMVLQRQERERLASRREGGTKFEGQLADIGVVDLVQIIEINRKSGIIHVQNRDGRRGALYFRDGLVIDAETGQLQGAEAVYRIFAWSEGSFEVEFKLIRRRDTIELSTQALLMEGMRRLDEWTRLVEAVPALDARVELDYRRLVELLPSMPNDATAILRLLAGRRTLFEVIEDSDLPDLEALGVIGRLHEQGLFAPPGDEAQGEWVAERRSPESRLERWLAEREDARQTRDVRFTASEPPVAVRAVATERPPDELPGVVAQKQSTLPGLGREEIGASEPVAAEASEVAAPVAPLDEGTWPSPGEGGPEAGRGEAAVVSEDTLFLGVRARRRRATLAVVGLAAVGTIAIFALVRSVGGPRAQAPETAAAPSPAPTPVELPSGKQADEAAALPASPGSGPSEGPSGDFEALREDCKQAFRNGRGRYKDVVAACRRALAANAGAADVMLVLAHAELDRGKYAQALELATQVVAVDPSMAEAYVLIGGAEQIARRQAEAKAAYSKYLELAPAGKYAEDVRAILKSL